MDRTELSSAIRQEMQVLVGEALEAVAPEMLTANLATLEQRVQQVGRVILGGLIERVATAQAQGLPRPARHAPSQTHARSTSAAPAPLRLGNFAVAHPHTGAARWWETIEGNSDTIEGDEINALHTDHLPGALPWSTSRRSSRAPRAASAATTSSRACSTSASFS